MNTKKLLRALIGSYLANPIPTDWLVAADVYEETCDNGRSCQCRDHPHTCGALAKMWRARGRHYDIVMRVCARCLQSSKGESCGAAFGSLHSVDFHRRSKTMRVVVSRSLVIGKREPDISEAIWFTKPAVGDRYHTRRALELIDAHREILDAKGG